MSLDTTTQYAQVEHLLRTLSDVKMELLIRAYIKRNLEQMQNDTPLFFHMRVDGTYNRNSATSRGYWTVGRDYSGNVKTEGEILTEVVTEQNRRTGWTSTLLQLTDQTIDGESD